MPRKDRNPRRRLDPDFRRAAILDAAQKAFATHPYTEVTISAISTDAEASNALVYRYFDSKETLYVEVIRRSVTDLVAKQKAALDSLPPGVPARDRVRAATLVYLDHIADSPEAWALPMRQPGSEPPAAAILRAEARRSYVDKLRALLIPSEQQRHDYALWGFVGFVDTACLRWVDNGCVADERGPLVEATLGALEGALGDWAA